MNNCNCYSTSGCWNCNNLEKYNDKDFPMMFTTPPPNMTTPQQVLQKSREEFDERFEDFYDIGVPSESEPNAGSEIIHYQKLKSFFTSTLRSFIEAEIERLEGRKLPEIKVVMDIGYNQAIDDQISHFKELLITLKR